MFDPFSFHPFHVTEHIVFIFCASFDNPTPHALSTPYPLLPISVSVASCSQVCQPEMLGFLTMKLYLKKLSDSSESRVEGGKEILPEQMCLCFHWFLGAFPARAGFLLKFRIKVWSCECDDTCLRTGLSLSTPGGNFLSLPCPSL